MNCADSPRGNRIDPGDHKDSPYGQRLRPMWLVLALFVLPVAVCHSVPAAAPAGHARTVLVDGRQVPVFETPAEQLSYARSTFEEIEEKSAALKSLGRIHPSAREYEAVAALELAFLSLGEDYRLAGKDQFVLAKKEYLAILDRYPDLSAIAAKAIWYLGWISCDLEANLEQGIGWYRRLITLYPEERLSIVPPAPWLTIRQADPDGEQNAPYLKAVLTWADIAHLEIIRYTKNRAEAWQSFTAIQKAGGGEAFAAAALKVLVEGHGFDEKSERLALEYLQKPEADGGLKNDLLLALSVYRRQPDGAGDSR